MLLDLHNHTTHSPDSRVSPRELVETAKGRGLEGLAITDHNTTGGIREAEEAAGKDFVIVPAVEVSSADGHVLAYGVREPVPRDLPVVETVDRIVAFGGIAVAAHPYRFWSGLGETSTVSAPFHAYETINARTLLGANRRAQVLARARRVGESAGSDSHFLDEVGRATTSIDGGLAGPDEVLQAIGQGRTAVQGRSRDAAATARYVTKCVAQWLGRGMRRI